MFNYFDFSQFLNYYHNFVYHIYYSPIATPFHFIVVGFVAYFYYTKNVKKSPIKKYFFPALLIRVFFVIIAFLLCEFPFHIGGDAMSFFTDSRCYTILAYQNPIDYIIQLTEPYPTHPFLLLTLKNLDYPRNFFIIKLLSLLNLITFSDYFADSFYLIFFVFLGTWKLCSLFVPTDSHQLSGESFGLNTTWHRCTPLFFLFLPTVCYFSSSTSKDSISIGALFFIIYYVLKIFFHSYKPKWFEYLWILILSYVLYKAKLYMLELIIPPALTLLASNYIFNKKKFLQNKGLNGLERIKISAVFFLITIMTMIIPVILVHYNSYSVDKIFLGIYNEYETNLLISKGSLYIHLNSIEPTLGSYLRNFPTVVFSTLYRPFIWEINSLRMIIPSLENLTVLIFSLVSVYFILKSRSYRNIFNNRTVFLFFLFLVSYVLLTAGILGITSPVFGSLLRYRIMIFPFFWILVGMGIGKSGSTKL